MTYKDNDGRSRPMSNAVRIPFNRPFLTGNELRYISDAHQHGHLSGDGEFTARCSRWLERNTGARRALLTHSCTGALEMAALLADLEPGSEVIMPSFTFVSTANAFCLRGAVPVFVDIRADTLNIDETLIEAAITNRTRAICVVHYAGVACEMHAIDAIAKRHGLLLIEDAAQAIESTFHGKALGTFGDLGTLSFHETKNVIAGEGGALLLNNDALVERAEIIREKGTNRSKFFRGQVNKYTWCDIGSSYLPSEVTAAFLWAQLENAGEITARRITLWNRYHEAFAGLEEGGLLRRPTVPAHCRQNAHMYYILLPNLERRTAFIEYLRGQGIMAVFHYVPLHSSPAGQRLGRAGGSLARTEDVADRLVRLPMWIGLEPMQDAVIQAVREFVSQ